MIAPAQTASTTKVDSVSWPVFSVWSQRSRISKIGQAKQASRTNTVTTRRNLERTSEIVSPDVLHASRFPVPRAKISIAFDRWGV